MKLRGRIKVILISVPLFEPNKLLFTQCGIVVFDTRMVGSGCEASNLCRFRVAISSSSVPTVVELSLGIKAKVMESSWIDEPTRSTIITKAVPVREVRGLCES